VVTSAKSKLENTHTFTKATVPKKAYKQLNHMYFYPEKLYTLSTIDNKL